MRLLSWNVQWCRGMDGTVDPARVAREARVLADPDVCCFQEVAQGYDSLPGSAGEDQVAALRDAFPGFSAHFGWGVDVDHGRQRKRFGNLILSRLPVGRVLRHSLPWPVQDGTPSMPRVAVEAVVQLPWGPIRVTTTHLEYYSDTQRAAQVDRLLEINAEALGHARARPSDRNGGGPLFQPQPRPAAGILTGDFNMRPDDAHVSRLRLALADAWQIAYPRAPHPATFRLDSAAEAPYCCDFVFVTPDLAPRVRAVRVDADTRASDHQPIIVELG